VITLQKSFTNVFKDSGYTTRYRVFLIILVYTKLLSQILGQACDNALNNDTMLLALEALNPESMSGVHICIWCICHILNLVVKVSNWFKLHCIMVLTLSILGHLVAVFKSNKTNDGDDSAGDWIHTLPSDGMDEDEMDEEDLAATIEMDKNCQASDKEEIQDLAKDIDEDMQFFIAQGNANLEKQHC
jgi:hypothetical protein